jgi:chemotaxis protein CheD
MESVKQGTLDQPEVLVVHLGQGEYFLSDSRPAVVCAVLGSCVAVTMHAPELGIVAVNHAVLPHRDSCQSHRCGEVGYFVDSSTELIHGEMLRAGADPDRLQIKAFGAARVLCTGQGCEGFRVGPQNSVAVLETLSRLGLEAITCDMGGERGRKLVVNSRTGDVWVKKLVRNGDSREVRHG